MLQRILMEFIVAESRISSLLPCLFSLETPPTGAGDDLYHAPLLARHLYLSFEGKAIFASSSVFPSSFCYITLFCLVHISCPPVNWLNNSATCDCISKLLFCVTTRSRGTPFLCNYKQMKLYFLCNYKQQKHLDDEDWCPVPLPTILLIKWNMLFGYILWPV